MRAPKPAPRQLPTSVVTTLQQLVRRRRTLGRPPRHSAVGMTWAEAEVPEAERAGTRTSRGHGPSRWPPFLGRRRLPRRPRWILRRDDDVQVEGYTTRVKLLVPSSVMVLVAKKNPARAPCTTNAPQVGRTRETSETSCWCRLERTASTTQSITSMCGSLASSRKQHFRPCLRSVSTSQNGTAGPRMELSSVISL